MYSNRKDIKVGSTIRVNEACPNIDYAYGLYNSREEAYEALGENGDDVIALGKTVGILTENGVVEYWWKNGLTLDDLVPKGGGTSEDVITLLQSINTKIDKIEERLTTQEEEQASDEWEEF